MQPIINTDLKQNIPASTPYIIGMLVAWVENKVIIVVFFIFVIRVLLITCVLSITAYNWLPGAVLLLVPGHRFPITNNWLPVFGKLWDAGNQL
jgi:hypothetical protein